MQNLSGTALPSIGDLLGRDPDGRPVEDLTNKEGQPQRDIILRKCYRNTPWALAMAHALGFRIYGGPPIQGFDDPTLWRDVGYSVVDGHLAPGSRVVLERDVDAIPEFFPRILEPEDAVIVRTFPSSITQIEWVTEQIAQNLTRDELEPSDILVILPNAPKVPEDAGPLVAALRARRVASHITGVTRSRDEFMVEGSIAISGIYRAKGNEAPVVYVLNAQYCQPANWYRRNVLFTAITRSRAWVRICGWGNAMATLQEECDTVRQRGFRLEFRLPTPVELEEMRKIQRDRTAEGEEKFRFATAELTRLLEEGFTIDDLPPALRKKLRTQFDD